MKIQQITSLGAALFLAVVSASAANYSLVHSFGVLSNISGFQPQSTLVQDVSGTLYGTTSTSEGDLTGTIFKVQPNGTGFQVLMSFGAPVNFTNAAGANPYGGLVLSGNTLYGTAYNGGAGGSGTIFALQTDGSGFAVLTNFPITKNLTNTTGSHPYGGLILSNNVLYGTTQGGGTGQNGTVFSINVNGTGLTVLKTFSLTPSGVNTDGAVPDGTLVLSNNVLYGTTTQGGASGAGTVFALDTGTLGYNVLHTFTGGSDGGFPHAGLCLYNGWLFGTASGGGASEAGVVFMLNVAGTIFNPIYPFTGGSDGSTPDGGVVLAGNMLYGTAYDGGATGFGTVYGVNTNGSGFTVLSQFDGNTNGGNSVAGLLFSGSALYGTTAGATGQEDTAGGNGTVFAVNTNGSFTNLYTFAYSDGVEPHGALVGSGNVLYGTTFDGGTSGNGVIFQVNRNGSGYTVIKNFPAFSFNPLTFDSTNSDGANPQAGLVLAGGTLYGTTFYGGSNGFGMVFSVNTNGSGFTTLYNFSGGNDGNGPQGALLYSGGVLYGTATYGGINNNGVVFSLNANGTGFTVLKTFSATTSGTNADGANPFSGLISSGTTLYGTTVNGGAAGNGSIFSINLSATNFTDLHNFAGSPADGANPYGSLVLAGGSLYGTTYNGGVNNNGTVFMIGTGGGAIQLLESFSALGQNQTSGLSTNSDGANPYAGLVLLGSTLYGTTINGGGNGYGGVFAVNTNGALAGFTNLYMFSFTDGANPYSAVMASGNALYGTTLGGGLAGDGTVFSLSFPLSIQLAGTKAVLTWPDASFALQSAPTVLGPYTTVPGAASPFTNSLPGSPVFYRLTSTP